MNKIFKYFMMVAIAIAGLSFASCSDDDDNYTVGEASDGAYLYSDFSSKTFLPDDNQTFTINVGRTNTTGEQSFELKCDNDKFTVPSTVNFKAGESTVVVPVTFNIDLGATETAQFVIPTEKSTTYGDDTISVSITRDYTWIKIGTADFTDNIFTDLSATVDVAKAKEGTNLYKFVTPMRTLYKQNGESELPGGVDLIFTMDENGKITMDPGIYDVESGTSLIEQGAYQFYYETAHYGDYCFFDNENGLITFSSLLLTGGKLYGPYTWTFNWNTGYPYAK